jgi:hypothetical protein
VSNAKQSRAAEFGLDSPLQPSIRLNVYAASRFIEDNDPTVLHQRTTEGKKLLLSDTVVATFIADGGIKAELGVGGLVL